MWRMDFILLKEKRMGYEISFFIGYDFVFCFSSNDFNWKFV